MFGSPMARKILLIAVMVLAHSGASRAETISVNFTGRNNGTPEHLHVEFGASSSGVAGVNGNDDWNDILAYGDSGMRATFGPVGVVGSEGGEAVITFSSRGTYSQSWAGRRIVPLEDPSGDMMDGHIEGRLDSFPWTVTVTELADDFPVYEIYAYLGDDEGGRSGSITLNGSSTVAYTSKIFDGTFVEATGGGASDYVVFRGVTGDSFVISGGGVDGANRTGLHGLEIVGVPEPSSLVLLAMGLLGFGWFAWRR
ncbi:MAG: PEP-CTERM sorting domain-containing protein [Thermoguttaceae bacterium]